MRLFLLAAMIAALGLPLRAQTTDVMTFDVYISGIKAGVFGISGVEDGGRYSASGKIRSTGLLSLIQEVEFDARATGRVTNGGYVPSTYSETTVSNERTSSAQMEYVAGVPQVKVYDPPQERREGDVDPATQGGTLDPMTAIFALVRSKSRDEVCDLDVFLFDGRRRSQVVTNTPQADGDTIECSGALRRVAGYSRRELERRSQFPFEMTYERNAAGTYDVTRVSVQTLLGRATLRRR